MNSGTSNKLRHRITYCSPGQRHCQDVLENNVYAEYGVAPPPIAMEVQPPSPAPSPSPTAAPKEEEESPTPAPDSETTEPPAPDVELLRCVGDSSGNFGQDALAPGNSQQVVAYHYQVQTTLDTSVDDLNGGLLKGLEKRLSELLADVLLDGCHSTSKEDTVISESMLRREGPPHRALQEMEESNDPPVQQQTEENNNAPVTGMSVSPADFVRPGLAGVQCTSPLVEGARRCYIIRGAFTLMGDEGSSLEWAVPVAVNSTRSTMNQGKLNDVHPDLVDITFVEAVSGADSPGNEGNVPIGQSPNDSNTRSTSINNRIVWPCVAGAAAVLILATALLFRRRRRSRGDEVSDMSDEYVEPYSPPTTTQPNEYRDTPSPTSPSNFQVSALATAAASHTNVEEENDSFADPGDDPPNWPFEDSSSEDEGGFPPVV